MSSFASIGHRRLAVPTVSSTNTLAASYAGDPANHGLVVTAEAQSAGRGQYERVWQAPAGSSILMSVLLFPPPEVRRASILTAWAALAVCETIGDAAGLQATIKWPNDVLIGGKKVCGILCEGGANHLVAGIGLNVRQSAEDFAKMELPDATSLAASAGARFDVGDLTQRLIGRLDRQYQRFLAGELMALEADWKGRVGLLGKAVRIEKMDGSELSGRLREMAFDGITLERGDHLTMLPPEAIRHLNAV